MENSELLLGLGSIDPAKTIGVLLDRGEISTMLL